MENIIVLPKDSNKPVKVCYEGKQISAEEATDLFIKSFIKFKFNKEIENQHDADGRL